MAEIRSSTHSTKYVGFVLGATQDEPMRRRWEKPPLLRNFFTLIDLSLKNILLLYMNLMNMVHSRSYCGRKHGFKRPFPRTRVLWFLTSEHAYPTKTPNLNEDGMQESETRNSQLTFLPGAHKLIKQQKQCPPSCSFKLS